MLQLYCDVALDMGLYMQFVTYLYALTTTMFISGRTRL